MSRILPYFPQTRVRHSCTIALDKATLVCYFRIFTLTPTAESSLPHGSRFLRPLTVHFRLHDRLRGNLQRHVFEQIVEYSWARNVSVVGNQFDGAGDVSVPGLGDLKELEDRVRRKQPLH